MIALLLLTLPLSAQEITLEQCYLIALDHNPLKRAAKEGALAAKENYFASYAAFSPTLTGRASFQRFKDHIFLPSLPNGFLIPSEVGPIDDYLFILESNWVLFDSGLSQARWLYARAGHQLAKQQFQAVKQHILLEVALRFYDCLSAAAQLLVAQQQEQRAQEQLRIAQKRYRAGSVPLVDVLRAKTLKAQSRLSILQARSLEQQAQGALNIAMGLSPETPLIPLALPTDPPSPHHIDITQALEQASSQRPEIQAGWQAVCQARMQVHEAQAAFGPKLVASGKFGRHDSDFYPHDQDWAFGFGLEWPLFEGMRSTREWRSAQHQLQQAQANYEQTWLSVRQEVWNRWTDLQERFFALDVQQQALLEAQEAYRLSKRRYEEGANTFNDLIDATTALVNAQQTSAQGRFRYASAYVDYLWSLGALWPR